VNYRLALLLWFCLVALPCCSWAQEEGGEDDPSITTSLGLPLSVPLNPTHQYAGFGLGVSAGVGYNLDRRNAFIGEFLWNWLFASDAALQPFKIALQSANVSGHANVFAFTATTDWSCEAGQAASTSSAVPVGFTAPPVSRGLFLKERPSLVIQFGFGGDTTALIVPSLAI
jgi:hypothetical protein